MFQHPQIFFLLIPRSCSLLRIHRLKRVAISIKVTFAPDFLSESFVHVHARTIQLAFSFTLGSLLSRSAKLRQGLCLLPRGTERARQQSNAIECYANERDEGCCRIQIDVARKVAVERPSFSRTMFLLRPLRPRRRL